MGGIRAGSAVSLWTGGWGLALASHCGQSAWGLLLPSHCERLAWELEQPSHFGQSAGEGVVMVQKVLLTLLG